MLSKAHKFLFIHVPKTGGNSIQKVLHRFSEDEIVATKHFHEGTHRFSIDSSYKNLHKHSTLEDYKQTVEARLFKSLFKFAVVRNPWQRAISHYFSPHFGKREWNRNHFLDLLKTEVQPLQKYLCTKTRLCRIQNSFGFKTEVRSKIGKEIDEIVRFEHLQEDFGKICQKIGIPCRDLPHLNARKETRHYAKYYDSELVEIVGSLFEEEIRYANYEFDAHG